MQRDLDASRLEVVHLTAAVKRLEGELEVRQRWADSGVVARRWRAGGGCAILHKPWRGT